MKVLSTLGKSHVNICNKLVAYVKFCWLYPTKIEYFSMNLLNVRPWTLFLYYGLILKVQNNLFLKVCPCAKVPVYV